MRPSSTFKYPYVMCSTDPQIINTVPQVQLQSKIQRIRFFSTGYSIDYSIWSHFNTRLKWNYTIYIDKKAAFLPYSSTVYNQPLLSLLLSVLGSSLCSSIIGPRAGPVHLGALSRIIFGPCFAVDKVVLPEKTSNCAVFITLSVFIRTSLNMTCRNDFTTY